MVVVAKVNAHGAQFLAVCAQGHAGKKASLLKGTVVLVVIKEIRPGIVGHVKIGPAIVVVVAPYDTQAIAVSRIVNPGFLGNLFECSITTIVKQQVAFTLHAPGATLNQHSFEPAELVIAAKLGKLIDIHMNVTRDEQVHVSIAVVVGPRGACAEASASYAGAFGYILEFAIAQVLVEHIVPIAGYVDVEQAVVIEVGDCNSHAPALRGQSGRPRNVCEFHVRTLVIERDHRVSALAEAVHGGAADHDDVEFAVIVAVEQAGASTYRFNDVMLFRR